MMDLPLMILYSYSYSKGGLYTRRAGRLRRFCFDERHASIHLTALRSVSLAHTCIAEGLADFRASAERPLPWVDVLHIPSPQHDLVSVLAQSRPRSRYRLDAGLTLSENKPG